MVCVNKILCQKGDKVSRKINVMEVLNEENLKPLNASRLDKKGEKCVEAVKRIIKEINDKKPS